MSILGKIFLYAALVGAIVALIAGGLVVKKNADNAVILAATQNAKIASDKAAALATQQAKDATQANADTSAKLATATSKIDDLTTQLTTAQKQATDAAAAVQTATATATTAQAALDAIKKTLGDETPDQYKADKAKAEADLTAAQSEQKILQDQLQASQTQIADLKDAINRSKTSTMPPGISGKVTFVDRPWNFIIVDVGLSNGVVPNGELIVYRGRNFLGKVRVTKADSNDAVAEILPDAKGDIRVGDSVLN